MRSIVAASLFFTAAWYSVSSAATFLMSSCGDPRDSVDVVTNRAPAKIAVDRICRCRLLIMADSGGVVWITAVHTGRAKCGLQYFEISGHASRTVSYAYCGKRLITLAGSWRYYFRVAPRVSPNDLEVVYASIIEELYWRGRNRSGRAS